MIPSPFPTMNGAADPIHIQINGENHAATSGEGLLELVAALGLPPAGILIEYNGLALLRDEWPQTRLSDGDHLEILRVVAGG